MLPLLLLGSILILLQQLILLPKFEDEGIEFLVIDLHTFELKHLSLELVDDDVLLVVLRLCKLVGPDRCLRVIQILAVHLILNFIKVRNNNLLLFRYFLSIKSTLVSVLFMHYQTTFGECQPTQQAGSFMNSSQSWVYFPQQFQYFLRSWKIA